MSKNEREKEKKKKSKDQRKRAFQAMRTGDLNKLFAKRYQGAREDYVFPDDDSGIDDLRILLGHYAYSNPGRLTKIAALRAPWLTGAQYKYMLAEAMAAPRMWTFQELGDHVNLTEAELCDLGIRTVGTVDVTSKQRRQARKVRDKDQKAAKRRAEGAKPHAESAARTKPWEAEGISRRTYYRRRQKADGTGGTNSSTVNLMIAADETVPRHDHKNGSGTAPTGLMLADINKPATSTVSKKGQPLEMSESRHDESVPRKFRKAA